ncbi:chalcone isomerase family protein [Thalassotalea euphylliae]|nr:chalcone isomerase family protein [Thalassotalea euphylliae]
MLSIASNAAAMSTHSNSFPQELTEIKQPLVLVGKAKFSVLFWDIYDSALFTYDGKYQADEAFLFEINYLRDISRDDLIERTVEQWQHLGVDSIKYQPFLADLANIWPNISKGDQLAMWTDGRSTAFYFNQAFRGQIADPAFSQLFASIWLSPQTSQPKLRKKLLGN